MSSYKVTPPLPRSGRAAGKKHEEAGRFKTKLTNKRGTKKLLESTDVFQMSEAAGRNYKKQLDATVGKAWGQVFTKFVPLSIGKSAYGDVYTVVVDAEVVEFMKLAAEKGTHRVVGQAKPKIGEKIAVKLVKRRVGTSYSDFVRENTLEATSHERMAAEDSCFEIPCAPGIKNCASDHIPVFYMSYLADVHVYVTFMSVAGSTTLGNYLKTTKQKLDAKMYASIEKAVAVVWASGFTHADLHSGNILVDPASKKAWVIDFGFAVRLPQSLRNFVRRRIGDIVGRGGAKSLGEVWSEKDANGESLVSYTNKATQAKGLTKWYNPNGRAVLLHYNKMSRDERAKFENVRKQLWGCKPVEYPVSGESSELEEGEIRPNKPGKPSSIRPSSIRPTPRPVANASSPKPYDACVEKCRAQGKYCNPKTLRCVKQKPASAAAANGYDACKRKCEAIGKECNPKTLRCVKRKPGAENAHDACKDKCGAVDKVCNPVTLRCITIPGMAAENEAGPAHGPATARNLSAIEKRLKRVPKGGLKKYLENKRAKCQAEGKKFNPSTGRCIKN